MACLKALTSITLVGDGGSGLNGKASQNCLPGSSADSKAGTLFLSFGAYEGGGRGDRLPVNQSISWRLDSP